MQISPDLEKYVSCVIQILQVCVCVCVFVHSITFLHTSDKQIDYDLPVDPTFCRCDNCVHELCHADLTRLENM